MRLFLLCLCLIVTACKPEISEPKGEILQIQRVVTKKGIEVWFVEDHSHPIIAMRFSFKGAGAINETSETQGRSRLLSNMLDEGAGDYPSQNFQKQLSDHSITLRFSSGRDNFGGKLTTLSHHQNKAFALLKLALTKPRFDNEPLERMKRANIARIQSSKGDPEWIRERLTNDIIYKGHPYALNSGGTISTLAQISSDDLRSYHAEALHQGNLVVSVVGDIDAKMMAEKIDSVFGALPDTNETLSQEKFSLKSAGKTFIYDKDIPQSLIMSILPAIEKDDPDYYALKVMNIIFGGGGFGSRLMEEIREKRGLTYGIYSDVFYQEYANGYRISTSTKNESAAEMINLVQEEMLRMLVDISKEEIEKAKSYIIGALPLSLTSTDNIANIVQNIQLDNRDIDYLDQYTKKINAVTAEDILRVSQRILRPEMITTIIVGQPKNIKEFTVLDSLPNVE